MPELVPDLKDRIKESSIDNSDENDEISAASARAPVGFAIVAAYQFRWFVSKVRMMNLGLLVRNLQFLLYLVVFASRWVLQVAYPHLGSLVNLVVPCALTALDHWSPEVKVCQTSFVVYIFILCYHLGNLQQAAPRSC